MPPLPSLSACAGTGISTPLLRMSARHGEDAELFLYSVQHFEDKVANAGFCRVCPPDSASPHALSSPGMLLMPSNGCVRSNAFLLPPPTIIKPGQSRLF